MSQEIEHISIKNINGGRLAAHIDEQLKLLVADIADPNKPAKGKRGLTVEIAVDASKSRREAEISYSLKLKLAVPEKEKCEISIGKVDGKPFASNQHVEQQNFEFTEAEN